MRRILVTGANKGIGLAIVRKILEHADDTFVYLGARNADRGGAAVAGLVNSNPTWRDRVRLLVIDVSSDDSVAAAAKEVADDIGTERLYGVVNNAGIGFGTNGLEPVMQVNAVGIRRVCDAFISLLEPEGGRVVNLTSAAGPNFVNRCSAERQAVFTDPAITRERVDALVAECLSIEGGPQVFAAEGLSDGEPYGLSKACANSYTLVLAAENPALAVNACTPGFIETDLTRHYAEKQGKAPSEMGMKTPAEGTKAPLHLLFGELEGSGRYYGSDAERSPLDRYRAPGDPPYTGD